MLRRNLQRRGFTLIEIIVVSALIALLSGIALFSINEMYIRNIRKVSVAEAFQLATALSIAENDLDFYPKLNFLTQPRDLVLLDGPVQPPWDETGFSFTTAPDRCMPAIDYWGFLRGDNAYLLRILDKWDGPYMGVSQARQESNRGAQSGVVKMRIPNLAGVLINGADISIVNWPADPFGNPYLLYQLKTHIEGSSNIPYFLEKPDEAATYKNMIVSYGRNRFPGGNDRTAQAFGQSILMPGALFVEGDPFPPVDGLSADYTLKVIDRRFISGPARSADQTTADAAAMATIEGVPGGNQLLLRNDPAAVLASDATSPHFRVLRSLSLESADPGNHDEAAGQVGIVDSGSDDIILEF